MKKNILLIEITLSGHHVVWLEKIANIFLKDGHNVTIAILREYKDNVIFTDLKLKFKENFNLVSYSNPKFKKWPVLSYLQNDYKLRQAFGAVFKKIDINIDYVFLPYLDYCINSISFFGSPFGDSRIVGISHHINIGQLKSVKFPPKNLKKSIISKYLYLKLIKNKKVKYLLTQDELLYRYVRSKKLLYMPDPADLLISDYSKSFARHDLMIPGEAIVILVYGSISDRKGLDILIEALSNSESLNRIHVLIVGKQQKSIDNVLKSVKFNNLLKNNRLHIINEFVDGKVQKQVFLSADIVWLGYRNFYFSSGVLSLAANTNNLILGTRDGVIGWYTKEKKLGEVFNVNDINSVTSAINKLSTHENIELYKQEAEFDYFDKFNWDNARLVILKSIT